MKTMKTLPLRRIVALTFALVSLSAACASETGDEASSAAEAELRTEWDAPVGTMLEVLHNTNVYCRPSSKGAAVGKAKQGTRVRLLEGATQRGFAHVESDGLKGFVWAGNLERPRARDDKSTTAGGGKDVTAGDGKVVFAEDFENLPNGAPWREMSDARVEAGCGTAGGKCLRVTYRPDSRGTPVQQTSIPIPPATEYSLTYDLRFDDGFEFVKGGKLPGLSPTKHVTGCKDIQDAGWSARLMWQREGGLKPYLYDQSKPDGECGRGDLASIDGNPFRFRTGRYYAITVHVAVNDPGESNGSVELYVDGELGVRMNDIRFRNSASEESEITRVLFSTFFGGHDDSWSPSKEVSASFDNFEVHPGAFVRQR